MGHLIQIFEYSNNFLFTVTPLKSCDQDKFVEPGFGVSTYSDFGARIFSKQWPPYDAHILQGLLMDKYKEEKNIASEKDTLF